MTLLVYNSSAGSGKTFTLVREYIFLALSQPQNFRHILAVTFTNKAANEMKQRVVKGLYYLSNPEQFKDDNVVKSLLPELAGRLECSPEEVSKKAGDALTAILHNYSDFSISTIDSFVNRIIRTFAHDLKLPLEFRVETDTDVLKTDSVRAVLNRVGVDQTLTGVLVNFIEESFESEDTINVEKLLLDISAELFKEDSMTQLEKLNLIPLDHFLEIVNQIFAFRKDFENRLQEIGRKAMELIEVAGVEIGSFAGGKSGVGCFFEKLSKGYKDTHPDKNKTPFKNFQNNSWYSGGILPDQRSGIDGIKNDLIVLMKEVQDLENTKGTRYRLFDVIHKTIYQLAVVNELDKEMDAIKRDRNIVHISEFNRRIAGIVAVEPAPFIYERMGERYNNYLLDEFQDTSMLQWLNLLPLLSESISTGNFNLVVGDGKQAIYRWRNGDVEQFIRLPYLPGSFKGLPNFHELENSLRSVFSRKELSVNYRSLPGIVNFNNRFFGFAANYLTEAGAEIYKKVSQDYPEGKSGGQVHIEFTKEKGKAEADNLQLERLVCLVREIINEGVYSLQDIAVLVRKNSQGSLAAQKLLEAGIDVVSSESLLLSSSAEVRLMIAFTRFLLNPDNRIIQVEICRLLVIIGMMGDTDFENKTRAISEEANFLSILGDSGIIIIPDHLKSLSLYDFYEELTRLFRLNEKVNPYILFFLEFIQNQAGESINDLNDLLEVWDQEIDKLSLSLPENLPAVRIFTIHKAKGLEFPVVIYPFVEDPAEPHRNRLWLEINDPMVPELPVTLSKATEPLRNAGFEVELDDEIQKSNLDMVNLLYVAMTRPIERLYILARHPGGGAEKMQRGSKLSANKLLGRFLMEEYGMDENSSEFHYIEEGFHREKAEKFDSDVVKLEKNTSVAWQENIRIAGKSTLELPDRGTLEARNWGNLVHNALSRIDSKQDCDKIIALISKEVNLSDEETAFLSKSINQVIEHPELRKYFEIGLEVINESDILTPSGKVFRPDRVVISDNRAIILDYKTGIRMEKHLQQIQEYADLLEEMGYVIENRILVYLGEQVQIVID